MFPDGLVTVDIVQYINGVSEDKIVDRKVSSVPLYTCIQTFKLLIKYTKHVLKKLYWYTRLLLTG